MEKLNLRSIFFALLTVFVAHPAISCEWLLSESVAELRFVKRLSDGVFLVRGSTDRNYVLRFQDPTRYSAVNVRFEAFASSFINRVPGLRAPSIRVLEFEQASHLASVLEYRHLNPPLASLAPYFPLPNGEEYLTARRNRKSKRFGQIEVAFIPNEVRIQLANYWVVYTALGIPDFHEGNWLITDHKHVIGIDMTFFESYHTEEGKSFLAPHQQPFGDQLVTPQLRAFFLENMSASLKQFLQDLSETKLDEIAASVGYDFETGQKQDILDRVQEIITSSKTQ